MLKIVVSMAVVTSTGHSYLFPCLVSLLETTFLFEDLVLLHQEKMLLYLMSSKYIHSGSPPSTAVFLSFIVNISRCKEKKHAFVSAAASITDSDS